MRTKQLFLILALLCTMVQGAWAQASWDEVYAMTNTTSANWTALPEGTTTGKTLGTAGTTTYYYADASLTFSNSTAGGSGLTILGNVYLYLPQGVTVTCTGANASGQTGAGAGIELTEGNVLFLLGKGSVNATGGNAADGCNGGNGGDADWDNSNDWSGTGGTGGHGGGGAGAGIGTRGGQGGNGGAGAASVTSAWSTAGGGSGAAGQAGATAGGMGELYVAQSFGNLTATGGAAASQSGSAGGAGKSAFYDGTGYNYTAAGGGGGGGGGFGGAASNIGTGGPGGGGGGGGASGNLDWSTEPGYYVVKAPGGKGGQNTDGTWAAAGAESIMNHNAIKSGQVKINASGWEDDKYNYDNYTSIQAVGTGGSGNTAGSASTSEQAVTFNLKMPAQGEWDMVCQQTKTSQSQWIALPFGAARKGATLGTADATTYYYATGDRTFTNSNAGGSGLTILGTVHLFIASGQTITCTGANATAPTGGGAGIELTEGNTLCLIGSGKLVATGGQAANGGNDTKGGDAAYKVAKNIYDSNGIKSGDGGRGGDGGGGAGAGIGTRGADGGAGGAGGVGKQEFAEVTGNVGSNGVGGGTAADMGTLYVYQMATPTIEAHGGSSGTSGSGGAAGLNAVFRPLSQSGDIIMIPAPRKEIHDGSSGTSSSGAPRRSGDNPDGDIYSIGGGGGGGAGGFGGAASDIGSGGPGGGGGGGGASGTITYRGFIYQSYYQVGALGGKGGANADGTAAADGEETMINSEKTNVVFDKDDYKDYTLLGWYNGDNRAAGGAGANNPGAAARSGTYEVIPAIITLADNADNSTTISDAHGYLADVTLSGRTLYKDGYWNTLCLPFAVTIAGSPLAGDNVVAKVLNTSSKLENGTLTLNFSDAPATIPAGTPFIIKWDNTGVNLTENDLVFTGVTIDNTNRDVAFTDGQFKGNYAPLPITDANRNSIVLLAAGNKLGYAKTDRTLGAFRAYFDIPGTASAREFELNFGDDENTTGIIEVNTNNTIATPHSQRENLTNKAEGVFDLQGRRIANGQKPTAKGLYIMNGKRIVIK